MFSIAFDIKPLSVNEAWQGKRYKTPKYKKYEKDLLLILPKLQMPKPPYVIIYEFGITSQSDFDNPIKPLQDILCKKYKFNDNDILIGISKKTIIKNKQHFFKVSIFSIEDEEVSGIVKNLKKVLDF